MASSAAPVPTTAVYTAADANAAVAYSTFNSLRLGRSAQSVVGRLIRFWDTHNFNKNGDFMGITILLLDEQDSVINGFIPANLTSQLRSSLKAGSIVRLDGFEVDRIPHMYKITEHQFVIRFISSTRIDEVFADGPVIKSDKFMVRRIDHLQVLANTNLKLSDVVGEIRSVKGSDLQNNAATSRIVVRLLIEMTVTVNVYLWDEAASTFRGLLKAGDKSQSVVLLTSVNPKLFGGELYLNSTQGTWFFFDTAVPEIAEFVGRDLERLGNPSRQSSLFIFSLSLSLFSFHWISFHWISSTLLAASPLESKPSRRWGWWWSSKWWWGDHPSVVMVVVQVVVGSVQISSPLSLVSRSGSRSKLRWNVLNPSFSHSLEGVRGGSSSTLGIHRSSGGIQKNMEAPIGAVVESTRIWGRSLARATHGERKDEPAARGGI
ncbi:hypothetical protein DY000_02007446 [Brassica cretica]|uniref:Replication protein A 70 kDa DNA-binding subunit B/D first OB fold domain-containing protein n=1 Tax=Brassica cretica TaxID=69181 RepID=A0ABQ7CKP2_BRACR|nr:hypothetical protein DY000_02007446 [Brassica cretica]